MSFPINIVSTLTEIDIPESVDIAKIDDESEVSNKWLEIMQPLFEASGHRSSSWGRYVERKETVLLVTTWESVEDLNNFRSSPSFDFYMTGISQHMSSPPIVQELQVGKTVWYRSLRSPGTEIVSIYFPSPITDERREQIASLRDLLSYRALVAPKFPSPISNQSFIRWSPKTCTRQGKLMDVLLCFNFWASPEKEEAFKRDEIVTPRIYSPEGSFDSVNIVEFWWSTMKDAGAVDWSSEHCDFEESLYYSYPRW